MAKIVTVVVAVFSVPAVVMSAVGAWLLRPKTKTRWVVRIVGWTVVILVVVAGVTWVVVQISR